MLIIYSENKSYPRPRKPFSRNVNLLFIRKVPNGGYVQLLHYTCNIADSRLKTTFIGSYYMIISKNSVEDDFDKIKFKKKKAKYIYYI